MARFFFAASNLFGGIAYFNGREAERLSALKIGEGETITLCTGDGEEHTFFVTESEKAQVQAEYLGVTPAENEPTARCIVYTAFLQGGKLDYVVQKAVELGAAEVVLFPSKRCVCVPKRGEMMKLLARLRKIARDSAELAGRGLVPRVRAESMFETAIKSAASMEAPLFCYELENENHIKDALRGRENAMSFAVFTGPEDGFTPEEAAYAKACGMETVSLGKRVLMCDTAPVCALAAVTILTDNM